jgi:hypothetical protein
MNVRFHPLKLKLTTRLLHSLALVIVTRTIERILQEFDVELCNESKDWTTGQTFHVGWFRDPLLVKMKPRIK